MINSRKFIGMVCACSGGFLLYILLSVSIRDTPTDIYSIFTDSTYDEYSIYFQKGEATALKDPPKWQKVLCRTWNKTSSELPADSVPLNIINPEVAIKRSNRNIFLLETACKPRPSYRAWCSIESWASQNPKGDVWYIMTSPYVEDPTSIVRKLLSTYKNLKITSVDLHQLFLKTPLKEFFESLKWQQETDWPEIHLSDISRVALVWTYGGYYSDTDVICLNSTSGMYDVIGSEDSSMYSNGQFHFSPNHTFLLEVMRDMVKNFNPKAWGSLGPSCFTRVVQRVCEPNVTSHRDKTMTCINMTLLPPKVFIPVHYSQKERLFEHGGGKKIEKDMSNTYLIHFFNKLTINTAVKIGSDSIYDVAAKRHCPVTYKFMSSHSQFF